MLELKHISKDYLVDKKPFAALIDINLAFPDHGFVSILGVSGCGKTTLLNVIGGLDHATNGDLLIDSKSTKAFSDPDWDSYRNEHIGFVFQSFNLIPHMSVLSNVEVSLMLNGVSHSERSRRALLALKSVGLGDVAKKKPNQLSGGQMQRVALARAIVNNPNVILADEPTGSLDSVTSVQVLDILKEISKTRCVIMVTHNKELAGSYSDRLITMKDGRIMSDSAPYVPSIAPVETEMIGKKTSMSFFTAVKSSGSNVLTKKTRTILTAVASSFGIIGVALVLALTNGFTNYVNNVEGSVASSVPIVITPVTYDYESVATTDLPEDPDASDPDYQHVNVYDTSSQAYVSHRNNYTEDYLNYIQKLVDKGWARSIMKNYINFNFHLLTKDGDDSDIIQVNQYNSAGSTGSIISSATSLPSTVFHELYGDENSLSSMYKVTYGRFPTKKNEIVLITDRYNRVELSTLKALGIVNQTSPKTAPIPFKDIVDDSDGSTEDSTYKEYKCYRNSDYYQTANGSYRTTVPAWQIDDIEVKADANNKIGFSVNNATAVNKTLNYYKAPASYENVYDSDSTYNPIDLKIVGVIRPSESSYINFMPSSLGCLSSLKDYLVADSLPGAAGEKMAQYQAENWYIPRSSDGSADGLTALKALSFDLSTANISATTFTNSITSCFNFAYAWSMPDKDLATGVSFSSFLYLNHQVGGGFTSVNPPTESSVTADSVLNWVSILQNRDLYNSQDSDYSSYTHIVDYLAYYSSYAVLSSILIFPSSLTTKEALRSYLDDYNTGKADIDQITYTDIMETFTSSLGVLISVVSVVLVVFASISLVVSCVMMGIITYVSVVERTKEIGILRACGARKRDVGRLFEAECVLIGAAAGLIGIGIAELLCIPANLIINGLYPGNNLSSIAELNPWHAVLLLVVSIVLSFISGFIPSRIAAKRDPVVALRSE